MENAKDARPPGDGSAGKRRPRDRFSRERWDNLWTLMFVSPLLFTSGGRNLDWCFSLILVLALLHARVRVRPTKRAKALAIFLFLLAFLSAVSPVDFDVRRGRGLGVRVLPAVYNLGVGQAVRDLESLGKVEDVDFVVIRRPPFHPRIRYSVVLFAP